MNRRYRNSNDTGFAIAAFTAVAVYLAVLGVGIWAVIELVLWVTSK